MSTSRRQRFPTGDVAAISAGASATKAASEDSARVVGHIIERPSGKGRALREGSAHASDSEKEPAPNSPLFFIHPIELTFYNLATKTEAHVLLDADRTPRWGNGVPGSQLVGISVSSWPRGSLLAVNSFLINYRNIWLLTTAACAEIHARVYVHTLERSFSGRVDLPPGATVTIESPVDRTTLAEHGLSSYTLALR